MLTRRELVKLGLLSGGYTVLASGSGLRRVFADDELPASPQLEEFQIKLPLPPEPNPLTGGQAALDPPLDPDCQRFIGPGTKFFQIFEEERSVQVHPALSPTPIWGYRDANTSGAWNFVLGPTFNVRVNTGGLVVRMTNNLPDHPAGFPDPLRGFGVNRMTTHLHGGHHPSRSDGFPDNINSFFDDNKTSRFHRFVSEPGVLRLLLSSARSRLLYARGRRDRETLDTVVPRSLFRLHGPQRLPRPGGLLPRL